MGLFLLGVGLAFAIEGLLYASFPRGVKAMMKSAADLSDLQFRLVGVGALALGVALVALARRALLGG